MRDGERTERGEHEYNNDNGVRSWNDFPDILLRRPLSNKPKQRQTPFLYPLYPEAVSYRF